ncbi:DNA polymerase III subunit delta' C-terminal domain-containing protein [Enterobacteriaceae endosymbiont of Donacia piscatrix]|uniref:DNA polymerase III subunit delta' C-terminal domain-containing protein n=1 Tax=Enterobacteriaceae endosymbiont of Donacia piscatrix TaxID=2675780 RepID=UPI001448B839|nr:DNA polymerase III subunit delta' C-terminal domain-containing protein [Enterobacteriaceae endosymbiont of Donacia piscatrix]QJC34802.1 hypothetical protein GJT96_00465 [Enterobacteriaceae endosymbiont of Donacia piscatrix]
MKKKTILSLYPWLNSYYNKIINQFQNEKNYTAYIFYSLNELGITSLIYELIKWIFCINKQKIYSCSICDNCILVNKNIHPDLYIIKNNTKQVSIGVDYIRNLINKIYQTSYTNVGKIIWFPNLKQLNIFSNNALLKVLEEPPKNTYFFLQCKSKNELLPTIYSRCQFWNIVPPNEKISISWLKKNLQNNLIFKKKSIKSALRICNYSPINTLYLLNNSIWKNRNIFYGVLISAFKIDIMNLLSILDNKNILFYLDWIYLILLDVCKLHLKINLKFFYNLDQIFIIYKIFDLIFIDKIILMIKKIFFYKKILIKINTINHKLVIINLLLSLEEIYKS